MHSTMPDPRGIQPFVFRPNTTGRFFDGSIRINNLGFRGRDIEPDKAGRFRVFALGESPTFGATIHSGDRAWPEVLQSLIEFRLRCARPVEVINAGADAYELENNIKRLRSDIVALKPDVMLSYHGINGRRFVDSGGTVTKELPPEPTRTERTPSALINEAIYR